MARILFTGFFTIILGLLIGFFHEARMVPSFQANPVSREAFEKSLKERKVVFHQGRSQPVSDVEMKIRQIATGGGSSPFSFLEGDLNQVANRYLNFSARLADNEDAEPSGGFTRIHPKTPTFHLDGEILQITTQLDFSILGMSSEPWIIVRGNFSGEGADKDFTVEEAWINSARIPSSLGSLIMNRIGKTYRSSSVDSPILTLWDNMESLRIQNSQLIVHTR